MNAIVSWLWVPAGILTIFTILRLGRIEIELSGNVEVKYWLWLDRTEHVVIRLIHVEILIFLFLLAYFVLYLCKC